MDGKAENVAARSMAHQDPGLAHSNRMMARRPRRGLQRLPMVVRGGARALVNLPSSTRRTVRAGFPGEPRLREAGFMLVVLLAACVASAGIPVMAVTVEGTPTPAPSMAVAAATPSPEPTATATPTLEPTPTPTPEPTPTATPTEEPSPSPTATPTPTAKPTAKPKPTPKPHRVYSFITLGDSLTSGYNTPGHPWPSLLDAKDPYLTLNKNAGIAGNTTFDMRARIASDVWNHQPNYVFILGGTNDVGHGIAQATTIANLRYMVVGSLQRHVQPILLLVPPNAFSSMDTKIRSLNAAIVHLANSYRIVAIDLYNPLATSTGTIQSRYTSDGLHFSALGSQAVANLIYVRVRRLGI